jgi:CRISPR/Cas system CSM-associated protein Csm4 (group 5 of RAMP superfamily)
MGERIRRFFTDGSIFPSEPEVMKVHLIGELEHLMKLEEKKKDRLH